MPINGSSITGITGGVTAVYEAVVSAPGSHVTVAEISNEKQYHSLRVMLTRQWSKAREVIVAVGDDDDPLSKLSLCSDYSPVDNTATFYLGRSRRPEPRQYSFSISATTESKGVSNEQQGNV